MTKSIPPKNLVLYADDDVDDLQLVKDAFEEHSSNVDLVTVKDGVEALSYLKNIIEENMTPCLIILDINMPRMNGKETLLRLREIKQLESVPVILFTTSSQTLDKKFAQQYNAGFITKPIDTTQLNIISDQFIEHCNEEVKRNIRKKK
jgi:CheY-like chemotaxis protein